jgi:hypothetical protein
MFSEPTRKPLPATLRDTPADSDDNVVLPSQCAGCGHDDLTVMLRTTYVVYVRCERCLTMRTVARPVDEREFGT